MNYIKMNTHEDMLKTGDEGDDIKGYFIQPTIFADLEEKVRLMQEEIFGPVLAIFKAYDFGHMIEIATKLTMVLSKVEAL